MILSVSLMAHERRAPWVDELLDSLDRPAPVAWDRHNSVWDTGSRAWELYDPAADWHLVLQDDVLVVPDLLARTEALLDGLEEHGVVSLCSGRGRPRQGAVRRGVDQAQHGWMKLPSLLWSPAIILTTKNSVSMLEACRRVHHAYDRRFSHYYERQTIPTHY